MLIMRNSEELIQTLEKIVEDYKKFQKESREILGYGHTDKRYIIQKKELLDKRLNDLKVKWLETLTMLDPQYGQLYKRTVPTTKTLNAVKQMEK